MRYSYAWPVTPDSLVADIPTPTRVVSTEWHAVSWNEYHNYSNGERFVRLEGRVLLAQPGDEVLFPEGTAFAVIGEDGGIVWLNARRNTPIAVGEQLSALARVAGGVSERPVLVPIGNGRYMLGDACATVYLDATASRLHAASVAGLVVAAFGTFVFGLYLRRWLKERGVPESGTGEMA
ncbi:MAG: hypothetical protein ACYTKD_00030 [Planctomycetota bacterium]|jgi:hypothetical protein